jgi:hypothetical protein
LRLFLKKDEMEECHVPLSVFLQIHPEAVTEAMVYTAKDHINNKDTA